MKLTDVTKGLSVQWREMHEDGKKVYQNEADKQKEK
jgi:hypothetical protein